MTALMAGDAIATPQPTRHANQVAFQITGRAYISHSQLSLMRRCPRQFAFHYVEQVKPEFVSSSLVFGGAIHTALEYYYRTLMEGEIATVDELLKLFEIDWRADAAEAPVRYNKGEDEAFLHALAHRTLIAFMASSLATPKGTLVGIEEQFIITLHPDLPDVLARVDLVTHTDAALHVIDFKTSRSKWTQDKALESADQLVLYGVTAAGMSADLHLPVKLAFAVITKAKTPVIQLLPVPNDPQRVINLTQATLQTWAQIKAGSFPPNPGPQNCTSCQYKRKCPVFAASG